MCFGQGFPSQLGFLIRSLEIGDEVVIFEEGISDITTYIWKKDGYAALTASGHILTRHGDVSFFATGNHQDDFEVSPEAEKIQAEIEAYVESLENDSDPLDIL